MKVMIIGGKIDNESDFNCLKCKCIEIGKNIRLNNHTLSICSPFEDSADYWAYIGYISNDIETQNKKVEFHYVNTPEIESKIEKLKEDNKFISSFPLLIQNRYNDYELKYSWLLCQLKALENSDCLIAIGGKNSASANMLLKFAEWKEKIVIPFSGFGGAARQSYERLQYRLKDMFDESIIELSSKSKDSSIINKIGQYNKYFNERKIFISYAQKRPYEADYIEILLRRRGIKFFRDENEFGAGENVMEEIEKNLYRSNTFIAVYCSEYACSPWCFDELELALDLKEKNQMDIWIIRVDDTRIVSKRARTLNSYEAKNRKELEGKLLSLLSD